MIQSQSIKYIAQQIILLFTHGRPTTEGIDEAEVEAFVVEALSTVGTIQYFENMKATDQHTVNGSWQVTYTLDVTTDAVTGHKCVVLTENPLALPKNRSFIRFVSGDYKFEQIDYEYWDGLEGGSLASFMNKYFFCPQAGKALLLPKCKGETLPINLTQGKLTMAVASNETATEAQVMALYPLVEPKMNRRFGVVPDLRTDNVPTTL